MTPDSTGRARDLVRVLPLAALAQFICAMVLGGRLHPDETHQYLEVAHRFVWGYGARAHEWHSGMRNVVAPGAVAAVFALARSLGVEEPRAYVGLVHVVVGALSLVVVACAYDLVARVDRGRAYTVALVLALWLPWSNLAFRTLGETFSVITLMVALRAWERPSRHDFAVGAWLALGFALRYPAGVFMVPFAASYALRRDARGLARWSLGVALVVAALGVVDHLAWGRPWHSVLAYADFNLVRDRARIDYGSRPAWFYLACLVGLSPFALLAAAARGATWRRGGMTLVAALTYLAVMSALAHKEPRFFLTVVPVLVTAAGLVAPAWSPRASRALVAACALHAAAALAVYLRDDVCEGDATRAMMFIGRQPAVDAVAIVGVSHPGCVYLHRDVPVFANGRADAARGLAALDRRWRVAPGRAYYAVAREGAALDGLRARGWRVLRRVGNVAVCLRGQ